MPVVGEEKEKPLAEGHVVIPSQWVDVDKKRTSQRKTRIHPKDEKPPCVMREL